MVEKFRSGYKLLDNNTKSVRLNTADSEVVMQTIEANEWVALGEYRASLAFYSPGEFIFMPSAKISRAAELCLILPKYYKSQIQIFYDNEFEALSKHGTLLLSFLFVA